MNATLLARHNLHDNEERKLVERLLAASRRLAIGITMAGYARRRAAEVPSANQGQAMTSEKRQLHLLGGFRLVTDGCAIAVPPTAAKLIALLAITGRPMSRSQIAGTVWPELTEQRALANLRSIMWRLPAAAQSVVEATGTTMSLADAVAVDLHQAGTIVRRVLDHHELLDLGGTPDERDSAPVTLLSRPLLPEWEDDWLVFERERISQLHIHALERLAEGLLATGDPRSAADVSVAVLGAEPLRESSHILVIRAHLQSGNRLDARRCYLRYRDLLRQELDVEPSLSWTDLAVVGPEPQPATPPSARVPVTVR